MNKSSEKLLPLPVHSFRIRENCNECETQFDLLPSLAYSVMFWRSVKPTSMLRLSTLSVTPFRGIAPIGATPSKPKGAVELVSWCSGAAWHVSAIAWESNSPCYEWFARGRLHTLSFAIGKGSRLMHCYVLYGLSGARWNASLRAKTHALVEAVLQHAVASGLPCIFGGGDLNLTLKDSYVLQRLHQMQWTSLAALTGKEAEPTCFKGPGSTIDFVCFRNCASFFLSDLLQSCATGSMELCPPRLT